MTSSSELHHCAVYWTRTRRGGNQSVTVGLTMIRIGFACLVPMGPSYNDASGGLSIDDKETEVTCYAVDGV